MWQAIQYVGSAITLIAFIAATVAWIFKVKVQKEERLIKLARVDERTELVRDALEFFRVDTANLSKEQQFKIAFEQIHARAQRFKIAAIVVCIIAVLAAIVTIYTIIHAPNASVSNENIEIKKAQPVFVISKHQLKKEGEDYYADEELRIQNVGGPAKELKHTISVWYELRLYKKDHTTFKTNIPVNGYYPVHGVTSDALTGLLVTAVGDRNNERATRFERQVCALAKTNGFNICLIEMFQYVGLSYLDLFDRHHTNYFYVRPVSGGEQINGKEGEKWVEDFSAKFWDRGGLEFYGATPEQMLERARTAIFK
ncbi:MAG: hypothetical protein JWM68_358 [Verrucomicrobiales bacterium]|nr:hypothetical protein [Verrucomicrobiales bacterium]